MTKRAKRPSKQAKDAGASPAPGDAGKGAGWFRGKWPVIRFVVVFAVLMGIFEALWATGTVKDNLFPSYLEANAGAGAWLIRIFGHNAQATGITVSSPAFSIEIARGCDAIEPAAIFLAGVVAFPAPVLSKVWGMLIGTVTLLTLNLVRIASLFFVGIWYPKLFHMMHVDVWQAIFIFLAILFWVIWALWATKPKAVPDASSPATA
ncbi:MAG TPA: hypothetical protein VM243_10035 [Phycisphaerae bacterium]|nr:hypothetical protein [Phycisphaerae bacterium]